MAGVKVGIRGGKELAKKFRDMGRQAEGRVDQVLLKAGFMVERDVKNNTPVDTGRLRSSVATRLVAANRKSVEVGTNVRYARFVHAGTSKMPARPFLTSALEKNKPKIVRLFKDVIK
ncbi:MAG: HK97-gp10 family putative phage morphogenesis protein [Thermincolia bacterium]